MYIYSQIHVEMPESLVNYIEATSYVTVPPDIDGWRRVTLLIGPFAERIQIVRGPCCEKFITFVAISCKP